MSGGLPPQAEISRSDDYNVGIRAPGPGVQNGPGPLTSERRSAEDSEKGKLSSGVRDSQADNRASVFQSPRFSSRHDTDPLLSVELEGRLECNDLRRAEEPEARCSGEDANSSEENAKSAIEGESSVQNVSHEMVPSRQYERFQRKGSRKATSRVWQFVKLLKGDHAECGKSETDKTKRTHVCIYENKGKKCYALIRCMRNSFDGFNTTEPLRHFRSCHIESTIGKEQAKKEENKKRRISDALVSAGYEMAASKNKHRRVGESGVTKYFESSPKPSIMSIALAKAARWYMYGKQRISKSKFDDEFFRDMLSGYFEAGGGSGKVQYLTRKGLLYYVHGEFTLFKMILKHVIASAAEAAEGNKFIQCLHDGGTLSDKRKRLAVGIQFIDKDWDTNHVICLGMSPLKDSSAASTVQLLREMARDRMGLEFDNTVASLKQDVAAAAVARAMELEVDHCDMHQSSKISQSAVGLLVRSKNRTAVNPFSAGTEVMTAAHNMGKHFSYSTRHSDLIECCKSVNAAPIRIKLDINGTRVTAQHGLLHSLIRLNKALQLYQMTNNVGWALNSQDWANIRFFEAIPRITDKTMKLVQHEKLFIGSLSVAVKMEMIRSLRSDMVSVVNLEAATRAPKLPRVDLNVMHLSTVSAECLKRARLEAERRYCGNTTEELTNKEYIPSARELEATLLDLRMVNANHLSKDLRKKALSVLKVEYIAFGKRTFDFKSRIADACLQENVESEGKECERNKASTSCDEVLVASQSSEECAQSEDDLGMQSWGIALEEPQPKVSNDSMPDYEAEFEEVWPEWVRYAHNIAWKEEFELEAGVKSVRLIDHLMPLNVGKLYKRIAKGRKFGHLPLMARASVCNIGALPAESFCERIISAGNIVVSNSGFHSSAIG